MKYVYDVEVVPDYMYIRFVQISVIQVLHGCITGIGQHYVIAYRAFN